MAVLSAQDRARIQHGLMRYLPFGSSPNVLKPDLLAAINATDDWQDTNQASYNAALPVAFRNNATQAQKTLLFCAVALMRVGIGLVNAVFGEVE